jgi:hypothetical protein
MAELFDIQARAIRRDRAARAGPELFLLERAFADCLERLTLVERRFQRALLIGCPDPAWRVKLATVSQEVDALDPGPIFAERAGAGMIIEDAWEPPAASYDLVVAIGTLDSVNELPLALRLIRHGMRGNGLLLGAVLGADSLPQLRNAMRAADSVLGIAAPHVHPRIEASALAPLLEQAGFVHPVVDIDRVPVSYGSLERLIDDLRRMGGTNVLSSRPRFIGRAGLRAAQSAFSSAANNGRTIETFEIVHFAAWTKSS